MAEVNFRPGPTQLVPCKSDLVQHVDTPTLYQILLCLRHGRAPGLHSFSPKMSAQWHRCLPWQCRIAWYRRWNCQCRHWRKRYVDRGHAEANCGVCRHHACACSTGGRLLVRVQRCTCGWFCPDLHWRARLSGGLGWGRRRDRLRALSGTVIIRNRQASYQ